MPDIRTLTAENDIRRFMLVANDSDRKAWGVLFPDGTVALRWGAVGQSPSTELLDSMIEVEARYGVVTPGDFRVVWYGED